MSAARSAPGGVERWQAGRRTRAPFHSPEGKGGAGDVVESEGDAPIHDPCDAFVSRKSLAALVKKTPNVRRDGGDKRRSRLNGLPNCQRPAPMEAVACMLAVLLGD